MSEYFVDYSPIRDSDVLVSHTLLNKTIIDVICFKTISTMYLYFNNFFISTFHYSIAAINRKYI